MTILQSLRENLRLHRERAARHAAQSRVVAEAIKTLLEEYSFDRAIEASRERISSEIERRVIDGGRPLKRVNPARRGRNTFEVTLPLDGQPHMGSGQFFLLLSEQEAHTAEDRPQLHELDESVLARLRRNTIGFWPKYGPIKELDGILGLMDAVRNAPERLEAVLGALGGLRGLPLEQPA